MTIKRVCAAAAMVLGLASQAPAATFETLSNTPLPPEQIRSGTCTHRMTGEIETGDVARFQAMLDAIPGQDHDDKNFVLCLDSPGGNLTEGLKLGKMAHDALMGTYVPKGAECLSACAVMFMHGRIGYFETIVDFRMMHPGASVAFHAPSLGIATDTGDMVPSALVNAAYAAAADNIATLVASAAAPVASTSRPVIPLPLLSAMLSTAPDEFNYVDTLHKAFLWQIDIFPHGLKAPEGFDLEVGYTQMCHNMIYKLNPQSADSYVRTITRQDVDMFARTHDPTAPQVPEGHRLVKMTEMAYEQCLILYNKRRDVFEVTRFMEGREQGKRWLPGIYLFDPKTSLKALGGR